MPGFDEAAGRAIVSTAQFASNEDYFVRATRDNSARWSTADFYGLRNGLASRPMHRRARPVPDRTTNLVGCVCGQQPHAPLSHALGTLACVGTRRQVSRQRRTRLARVVRGQHNCPRLRRRVGAFRGFCSIATRGPMSPNGVGTPPRLPRHQVRPRRPSCTRSLRRCPGGYERPDKCEAAYIQAVAAPRVRGDGSPGPVHVDLVRRLLPRARRGGPPSSSMYRNGLGFFLYTLGWSLRPVRSEGVLALES